MEKEVFISSSLIKKINARTLSTNDCGGLLFGLELNKKLQICGAYICQDNMVEKKFPKEGIMSDFLTIQSHLPQGINIFGVFFKSSDSDDPHHLSGLCRQVICETSGLLEMYEDGYLTDVEFLILLIDEVKNVNYVYSFNFENSTIHKYQLILDKDNKKMHNQLVWFHLTAFIPLTIDLILLSSQSDDSDEFTELQNAILENKKYFFELGNSDIYLYKDRPNNKLIKDVVEELNHDNILEKTIRTVKHIILEVKLYSNSSQTQPDSYAPIFSQKKVASSKCADLSLPLDVMVVSEKNSSLTNLQTQLRSAIAKQIGNIKSYICANNDLEKCVDLNMPKVFHCFPSELEIFLSVFHPQQLKYPDDVNSLVQDKLLLSNVGSAFSRQSAINLNHLDSSYLLDVHIGLPEPKISGGVTFLVQGSYEYRHYLQDGFQDDGWGCAYRSLQTIISWFCLQNLCEIAVPTHKEIQQALVDVKDKPASFVSSRQWIGSTEVSFVLNKLLNIDCRICHVTDGSEMCGQARLIARHFETIGSPIMIGGGVLAHTIIGICWNELTGDVKYLVLDPHYTGEENLKTIQTKGWCGWKGNEF